MSEATPRPWTLCHHLKGVVEDSACPCGYRGVIWGPEKDAKAICQPGHDPDVVGQEGLAPQRYPREVEVANSQLIVRAVNAHDALVAALRAYVVAQGRMLVRWAEGDRDMKHELWKDLHGCEDAARFALALAEKSP